MQRSKDAKKTKADAHQNYVLPPYLSALKNFRSRRLAGGFRCGCRSLHVDTGKFKPVGPKIGRQQRFCLVCGSDTAEDEHHFVFDCAACCAASNRFNAILWGPAPSLSSAFTLCDPRVIAQFLYECFAECYVTVLVLLEPPLVQGTVEVPQI